MHVLWHAESAVTGSPVIGGGRVWALDTEAETLHALDPTTGASRESIRLGAVNRFATPAISGSDVIVPTLSGMAVVTAG
jgi:outer membrane protein assembly factor BamB